MIALPYRIQPLAYADLESHVDYLTDHEGLELAERFILAVYATRSRRAPRIRRSERPTSSPPPALSGLRLWPVPGFERWLVFYIPAETTVQIVRVLHGARDLPTLLDQ